MSFFLLFLSKSKSITSYHVTCYVTTVMCLFIVQKKKKRKSKENIKSRKIDKEKKEKVSI